mmetsp:Transcript_18439/g.50887  ORF Transcript_18439/g.50887 Transcript_18439/m.50887 type:complete len:259 (-) Transcript_18439:471-1247(-)
MKSVVRTHDSVPTREPTVAITRKVLPEPKGAGFACNDVAEIHLVEGQTLPVVEVVELKAVLPSPVPNKVSCEVESPTTTLDAKEVLNLPESTENKPVMLPRRTEAVIEKPKLPRYAFEKNPTQLTDVIEIQEVATHEEAEPVLAATVACVPNKRPAIVSEGAPTPVRGAFVGLTELIDGMSAEEAKDTLPTPRPAVTTDRRLPPELRAEMHTTPLSDNHVLASHALPPLRPPELPPERPIDAPTALSPKLPIAATLTA